MRARRKPNMASELEPSLLWHTPTTESHSVRQVSWLAGRSLHHPSSQHVNASDTGAIGSPLTVAGQLRFRTGFPLSFHPGMEDHDGGKLSPGKVKSSRNPGLCKASICCPGGDLRKI